MFFLNGTKEDLLWSVKPTSGRNPPKHTILIVRYCCDFIIPWGCFKQGNTWKYLLQAYQMLQETGDWSRISPSSRTTVIVQQEIKLRQIQRILGTWKFMFTDRTSNLTKLEQFWNKRCATFHSLNVKNKILFETHPKESQSYPHNTNPHRTFQILLYKNVESQ